MNVPPKLNTVQVVQAGLQPYRETWEIQRRLAAARRRGLVPDLLLLLEHPPTYTIGRRGSRTNLLIDEASLAAVGATCLEVDRGGDITFHGPGQLVCYVIRDLSQSQRSVRRFVENLERTVIDTLAHYALSGTIEPERPGVWIGRDKIAALGVSVSRGVSYHGFAINVDPDLRYFSYMIPCGIPDRGATSIARELGRPVSLAEVARQVSDSFQAVFEVPVVAGPPFDELQGIAAELNAADAVSVSGAIRTGKGSPIRS